MVSFRYKGYWIAQAQNTGGKAGKGRNKTSTVQVQQPYAGQQGRLRVIKSFRFVVGDAISQTLAIKKAKQFIGEREARND